jgi:hypothetical protein
MLDLYCSLPTATGCIPASSDPDHLPLVVLVRNKHKETGQRRPTGLFCRAGLVSCRAGVDLSETESREPADVACE